MEIDIGPNYGLPKDVAQALRLQELRRTDNYNHPTVIESSNGVRPMDPVLLGRAQSGYEAAHVVLPEQVESLVERLGTLRSFLSEYGQEESRLRERADVTAKALSEARRDASATSRELEVVSRRLEDLKAKVGAVSASGAIDDEKSPQKRDEIHDGIESNAREESDTEEKVDAGVQADDGKDFERRRKKQKRST